MLLFVILTLVIRLHGRENTAKMGLSYIQDFFFFFFFFFLGGGGGYALVACVSLYTEYEPELLQKK